MKILLAVDGSSYSQAAVEEVARRPWPSRTSIKVLSASELRLDPMAEPWILPREEQKILKAQRKQAVATTNDAAEKLRKISHGKLQVTTEVVEGPPKQVILEKAERWGADLIMVGSHGYGAVDRFLLGSVSQAVALHAGCSVEIVRGRRSRKQKKRSSRRSTK